MSTENVVPLDHGKKVLTAIDPIRPSPDLDILHPFLYSMTIVAPLFGFVIDTEGPKRVTVKYPPSISLANLFDRGLGGKRL